MNYKKITSRLTTCFRERWRQLLVIAIAITLPPCLVYAGRHSFWKIINDSIFEMGVIFFIVAMMGKWGKWLTHLLFVLSLFDFGLSFGCYLTNGQHVTLDLIYLIMGTNSNEISEFFSFYFPPVKIFIWLTAIILLILLYFSKMPRLRPSLKVSQVGAIVFLLTAILCFPPPSRGIYNWCDKIPPVKYLFIIKEYEPLGKLANFRHEISLKEVSTQHPWNIVIIIGESFAKSHSSVYGYKHDTNPELSHLINEDHLYAFTQCTAPAAFTHLAFKNIFTLWDAYESKAFGKKDGIEKGLKKIFLPWIANKKAWYKYPTLFDVFSQKYTIRWVSNQEPRGMFDNVQAAIASLSDTVWFAGQHPEAGSRYDEVVVPVLESFLKTDSLPSITIVNLMGQHENFYQRYPSTWNYFKADDYKDRPMHQRELLAQYDNATRYNDHVVASIFELYKDKCALVFYFPDHGMDLYDTDPNYCGHAIMRDQTSWDVSCIIPFFIYTTDNYRHFFPQQVEQIKNSLNNSFNTKDLIFALLQITGWKITNYNGKNGKTFLCDAPQ